MVRIKWHLQSEQDHDSDRDEESHIEREQILKTIMVRIKWYLQPIQ